MCRFAPSTMVAREFVVLANDGKRFSPLELQKLVFFAHGWSFPFLGELLVTDRVEAWTYGPVFPELYVVLRKYGARGVDNVPMSLRERLSNKSDLDQEEKELVNAVFKSYGEFSGRHLVKLVHEKGSPWDNTKPGSEIDSDLIKSFFAKQHAAQEEEIA